MDLNHVRAKSLLEILTLAAKTRRFDINVGLYQAFEGRVQAGPFKGMVLPNEVPLHEGDFCPKLLGTYEAELHHALFSAVEKKPSLIVNIGCAEGYYAVGMARLLPQARILGFERDDNARRVCHLAAELNGVAHRVSLGGNCASQDLCEILSREKDAFLLLDCEGEEETILDPSIIPQLAETDFIVECHDMVVPGVTARLLDRFQHTHNVQTLHEGGRDPNQYAALRSWTSIDRWLAVCEFRPCTMHWLSGTVRVSTR